MQYIRLAAAAANSLVGLLGEAVGPLYDFNFLTMVARKVGRQHVLKCLFHHLLLFGGVRLHTGCDFLRLLHAMIFIGIYKIKKMYQRIKILTAKNKKAGPSHDVPDSFPLQSDRGRDLCRAPRYVGLGGR